MKIDCSITENYLKEKARMYSHGSMTNGEISCLSNEGANPKRAINIVQQWSNSHQLKTYFQDLIEKYPNMNKNKDGAPEFCPNNLGFKNIEPCKFDCVDCWNQTMEVK